MIFLFHEQAKTSLEALQDPETLGLKTHERIGALVAKTLDSAPLYRLPILKALGVDLEDTTAHELLGSMLEAFKDPTQLQAAPLSSEHPDIVSFNKISTAGKTIRIALFKLGRRRAATELAVRRIAQSLNLPEASVPGMFCAYSDLHPKDLLHESEELWNGLEKRFKREKKSEAEKLEALAGIPEIPTAPKLYYRVGILVPHISLPTTTYTPKTLMQQTLFSIVIGLQDGKEANFVNGMLVDADEVMPSWYEPSKEHPSISCHLAFLDCPMANLPIEAEALEYFKYLVASWDIDKIIAQASEACLDVIDPICEQQTKGWEGYDEGGYYVKLSKSSFLTRRTAVDEKSPLFTPDQMHAFKQRLLRLKTFILSASPKLTCLELAQEVVPGLREALAAAPVVRGRQPTYVLRDLGSPISHLSSSRSLRTSTPHSACTPPLVPPSEDDFDFDDKPPSPFPALASLAARAASGGGAAGGAGARR